MLMVVFEESWTECDSIEGITVFDLLEIVLVISVVVMVVIAPVSEDVTLSRIDAFRSFL